MNLWKILFIFDSHQIFRIAFHLKLCFSLCVYEKEKEKGGVLGG